MGSFSIWHWLIVLAIFLLLFGGGGKIPKLMRDLGQGVTAFKRGLKEDKSSGQNQAAIGEGVTDETESAKTDRQKVSS